MINYVKMDIFESPAQVIVNTVNTVGVMGKGIAKTYKRLYPEMFRQYQVYCEKGLLDIGKLWIYKDEKKWILNFPTKKHWRNPSKIEYIEQGLIKFVDTYKDKGIRSISFPPLGCGNGGLDWESEVKPLMEKYLKDLDIDVLIHPPLKIDKTKTIEHKSIIETKKWLNSQPQQLSFIEVWEDVKSTFKDEKKIHVAGNLYMAKLNYSDEYNEEAIYYSNDIANIVKIIAQEDFSDAWNLLRQNNLLTDKMMSNYLKKNSIFIYAVLLELPYVEKIVTINNVNGKEASHTGVRLNLVGDIRQEVLEL